MILLLACILAAHAVASGFTEPVARPITPASNPGPPTFLRVDLHLDNNLPTPFVTLDSITSSTPNVSLSWALPPGLRQTSYLVTVVDDANNTAWTSGWVPSTQRACSLLPRTVLARSRAYVWRVAVKGDDGVSSLAASQRFFTFLSVAALAATSPVWAAPCGSSSAPPKFALFKGTVALPSNRTLLTALLFITGSPPIYSDPWNVTKILGGYKVRVSGVLLGVGPGRAACGPAQPESGCVPVQPIDGYDVSSAVSAAATTGDPLTISIVSYGVVQPVYNITPAVQAVLHIRWMDGGADTIFGTGMPGWTALDGDALFAPSGNKAPFWYTQPHENVDTTCLPLGAAAPPGCPAGCGWASPVIAPAAWGGGGPMRLALKTTRALSLQEGVAGTTSTPLGVGVFVVDAGSEFQGGVKLVLMQDAAPNGLVAVVELGSELFPNGTVRWKTRAGNTYQDTWRFPPTRNASAAQLEVEHHEFSVFRYAQVTFLDGVQGTPVTVAPSNFSLTFWVVRSPYDDDGSATVTTTNPDLDAVFQLCKHTLKATTLDFFSDSNTRQRSLDCMADDTTAALAHYATTTELALPRLVSAQIMTLGVAGYVSPNWADWTVLPALNIVNDYLYTGDDSFARSMFDILVKNHTYLYLLDPSIGLLRSSTLTALIDTSGGSDDNYEQSDVNTVVNAWAHASLMALSNTAVWLGRSADATALGNAAAGLRASFKARMLNASGVACDGLCATTPHTSFHASFYSLALGLVSLEDAPVVAGYLQKRIAAEGAAGVPCGAYPVQFLLQALYANDVDHGVAALGVLTSTSEHSWLNMMSQWGATTTMECWQPSELPNLTFSHVWSSSPSLVVPSMLFGVVPLEPGWTRFRVKVQPGDIRSGRAVLPSIARPIPVEFSQTVPGKAGGCFTVSLEVPGGCVAEVWMPRWGATVVVKLDGVVVPSTVLSDYALIDVPEGEHEVTTC